MVRGSMAERGGVGRELGEALGGREHWEGEHWEREHTERERGVQSSERERGEREHGERERWERLRRERERGGAGACVDYSYNSHLGHVSR